MSPFEKPPAGPAPQQLREGLVILARLLLLGALVGLACWPLNLVDHWQEELLLRLPWAHGGQWTTATVLMAIAPVLAIPLLLVLQRGVLASGAGSGLPQTLHCLERPEKADQLLTPPVALNRFLLWALASLMLLPLGREGPVVQLGATVAHTLRRRLPRLSGPVAAAPLIAVGGGAGLAGGFNAPLMGALFVLEELTGRYQPALLWPALVVCSSAALMSNLEGTPLFILDMISTITPEWRQMLWAIPMGMGAGLLGGLFSRGLFMASGWLGPKTLRRPVSWGIALGCSIALITLMTGGWSGGDGEAQMLQMLESQAGLPIPGAPIGLLRWILMLISRLVAPILVLAAGIPGGLIDPALAIGGLFGGGVVQLLGGDAQLGMALGMAAAMAGATQLPLVTIAFTLRMIGDQQWLLGILLSAVVGAVVGRRVQAKPIYHALRAFSSTS